MGVCPIEASEGQALAEQRDVADSECSEQAVRENAFLVPLANSS